MKRKLIVVIYTYFSLLYSLFYTHSFNDYLDEMHYCSYQMGVFTVKIANMFNNNYR